MSKEQGTQTRRDFIKLAAAGVAAAAVKSPFATSAGENKPKGGNADEKII